VCCYFLHNIIIIHIIIIIIIITFISEFRQNGPHDRNRKMDRIETYENKNMKEHNSTPNIKT